MEGMHLTNDEKAGTKKTIIVRHGLLTGPELGGIIGSPIDMLLIKPDGAQWLSKHNPAIDFDMDLLDPGVSETRLPELKKGVS